MSKNEKYFLNSLRYAPCHAALSSFQSSGRITADMRFAPRLGAHPNCSLRSQLLISANVKWNNKKFMAIEVIFYLVIFICICGLAYAMYEVVKNKDYYTPKQIWDRITEEKESKSLSSLPFRLLGLKVPNITSRKFDAIFFLTVLLLFIIIIIISAVMIIIEKL